MERGSLISAAGQDDVFADFEKNVEIHEARKSKSREEKLY